MSTDKAGQGNKTHEQFLRNLEGKGDLPRAGSVESFDAADAPPSQPNDPDARQSEFVVSRGGMHEESRDHNKHNNPGQSGHKPQKHSPAEEKH